MELHVNDAPRDEPLRGSHIRVYMEVTIPGSKRIVVSHDYPKETTLDELKRGNSSPLLYMGNQQWLKMIEGLEELNR